MANDLVPGSPRIGWFFDGDPHTPQTATLLQDTGNQIRLTIPWITAGNLGQYARWFLGKGVHFGDDPNRDRYAYEVPPQLTFRDVDGPVTLVGCRGVAFKDQMLGGMGQGVIRAQFAILGTESLNYHKVNGLRSQIPGLSAWVGISSLATNYKQDEQGRLKSVDLHLEAPDPIGLARALNLVLRPNFSIRPVGETDTTEVRETVLVETRVSHPRPWLDHLQQHNSVRDLLDVAAWRPFGYSNQWALRDDDPMRDLGGGHRGDKWSRVKTYAVRSHEPQSNQHFLFRFSDIGSAGFRRWERVRKHFSRGVGPLLSHFDHPRSAIETGLIESSIAFEAIGYRIALDDGASLSSARKEPYRDRVQRVLDQVPVSLAFDTAAWIESSAEAYNGVKHANRDLPDLDVMHSVLLKNWLVARLWIAGQIGVSSETLESNMSWWTPSIP